MHGEDITHLKEGPQTYDVQCRHNQCKLQLKVKGMMFCGNGMTNEGAHIVTQMLPLNP